MAKDTFWDRLGSAVEVRSMLLKVCRKRPKIGFHGAIKFVLCFLLSFLFIDEFRKREGVSMAGDLYGYKWEYVITSCRSGSEWLSVTQHYDPSITNEKRVIKGFSFVSDGMSFKFRGELSKYANETTHIKRMEVGSDTIHIWIDESISRDSDGYLFTKVQPQCRREFLAYVRARPFLEKHLVLLAD